MRIRGAASFDGTTGTNGAFSFDVPPGTYTVEVNKPGFATASRTCEVAAGADAWCSVGMGEGSSTAPTTATVRGVVYEDSGDGAADTSNRLVGATIAVGSTRVTTDSAGAFSFEAPHGSVTFSVGREGYESVNRTCEVSGTETWCSVGLVRAEAAGTLQGVVYVSGDLSQRLEGATVTIVDRDQVTMSGAGNGYWRFELAAGTYEVRAEAPGFEAATRTCTVAVGGDAWCSIGLTGDGSTGLVVDERPPEDSAMDPYDPPGFGEDGTGADGRRHVLSGEGCAAGGASSNMGLLLFLMAFVGWRRRTLAWGGWRRGVAAMANLMVVPAAGCSGNDHQSAAATAALVQQEGQNDALRLAEEVASFARLVDVATVTDGDFIDVSLSPNGQQVALSHALYAGLSIATVQGDGSSRVLREGERSGYAPVWRADSAAIGMRSPEQTGTAVPTFAMGLDGSEAAPIGGGGRRARIDEDGAVIVYGAQQDELRLAPAGDSYFEPVVSEDGGFVAFRGLSTGLYVHRVADGATFMLGQGAHARFDGAHLVFERVIEDGHQAIASQLYLVDLHSDSLRHGVIAVDGDAGAPSLAAGKIAFMQGSTVRIGTLQMQ